ncbi:hypothetical protein CK203_076045 [Vitis vinifera]|uniref:RING-type domain-containing protein n=1 Tax=Vitis vinifera TaxID=29760 RepID=A0A438C1K1_VITVI|nr:hypothetical protein CK203_076045 [Vitis vinifera]
MPKAKEAVDFDSNCCGICLLEDDRAIRGWVDSCDHYFCFVCIMEWAKVESRCPMCKRRFSTIRRPPKPGVFPSERIVNVPVRDQGSWESCGSVPTFILLYLWAIGNAYHHFGNVTTGPSDPYAEVDCGICHGTADESFLLICDLCDSAAHTYCVGLGHTVPEEPYTREDERPPSIGSSHPNRPSSPIALNSENFAVNNSSSMSVARTLLRCRNVNAHIQALRENWNALRSGSMTFSSILGDSGGESSQKYNVGASCPKQDNNACSYDTEKAWKMMDKAKSIQRACERTGIIHQISDGISSIILLKQITKDTNLRSRKIKSKESRDSFQVDVHHRTGVRPSQKNLVDSFNAINERDGYGSLIIPDGPVPRSPDLSHANLKFGASSLCKEDLLHRPKGVDTFKEVARLATHTILAACGLEHSKSCVRSFPTSMCTHSEQVQQLHKSTLMPRSCRECFYAYVKDVVNFITVEKMGSTGSCRVLP